MTQGQCCDHSHENQLTEDIYADPTRSSCCIREEELNRKNWEFKKLLEAHDPTRKALEKHNIFSKPTCETRIIEAEKHYQHFNHDVVSLSNSSYESDFSDDSELEAIQQRIINARLRPKVEFNSLGLENICNILKSHKKLILINKLGIKSSVLGSLRSIITEYFQEKGEKLKLLNKEVFISLENFHDLSTKLHVNYNSQCFMGFDSNTLDTDPAFSISTAQAERDNIRTVVINLLDKLLTTKAEIEKDKTSEQEEENGCKFKCKKDGCSRTFPHKHFLARPIT
eukprot:snap_masked-scaffold_7-processed-gene-2.48-mRNA-1 protein AED:0.30 eAED:1.00 QI:0/-1/0/1/-1/1/1/0/282